MSGDVVLKICSRITQRYVVRLEEGMDVKPSRQTQRSSNLGFSQGTRSIALQGNRLTRPQIDIVPLRLQCSGYVGRKIDGYTHGVSSSFYAQHAGRAESTPPTRDEQVWLVLPRQNRLAQTTVIGQCVPAERSTLIAQSEPASRRDEAPAGSTAAEAVAAGTVSRRLQYPSRTGVDFRRPWRTPVKSASRRQVPRDDHVKPRSRAPSIS